MPTQTAKKSRVRRCASGGLYDPNDEKDACGLVAVAQRTGEHPRHETVRIGERSLKRLDQRGSGCGKTADGTGVLTSIPERLIFGDVVTDPKHKLGVAMLFLPREAELREAALKTVMDELKAANFEFYGIRKVPVNEKALGRVARETMPEIVQVRFGVKPRSAIGKAAQAAWQWLKKRIAAAKGDGAPLTPDDDEMRVFAAMKRIEQGFSKLTLARGIEGGLPYVVSMSTKTIVYKALTNVRQLFAFYPDLNDERYEVRIFIGHRRYSTNTRSTWPNVQPFRLTAHNGEINTVQGAHRWWLGRTLQFLGRWLFPIHRPGSSDSGNLDETVNVMNAHGMSVDEALRVLLPPSYKHDPKYSKPEAQATRAYFDFWGTRVEPWDGPAGILATDGRVVVAILDRCGLRPLVVEETERYYVVASEIGVSNFPNRDVHGRFQIERGEIVVFDVETDELRRGDEVNREFASRADYGRLANIVNVPSEAGTASALRPNLLSMLIRQLIYGWRKEDIERVIGPLAADGKDPKGSMGDDTPFWAFRPVFTRLADAFRQLFSQVTNPALDPLREADAFDMEVVIGPRQSPFHRKQNARLLRLQSPVLSTPETDALLRAFRNGVLTSTFDTRKEGDLEARLDELRRQATRLVRSGAQLLILDDGEADTHFAPLPLALTVAAVHRDLLDQGLRFRCSIICRSREARDAHEVALLLTYGAEAVNPVLCEELLLSQPKLTKNCPEQSGAQAWVNWKKGVTAGVRLIMGRMGITPLSGFTGAQMLVPYGLEDEVVLELFPDYRSRIGGLGYKEIEAGYRGFHAHGMAQNAQGPTTVPLPELGRYRGLGKPATLPHGWSKAYVDATWTLVTAETDDQRNIARAAWYAVHNSAPVSDPRSFLGFRFVPTDRQLPRTAVQSIAAIKQSLGVAPMSDGALSPEAHLDAARAASEGGFLMNNGEGGLAEYRYGTDLGTAIRQVASGRFGVTIRYLADRIVVEINVKVVQAVKPGQGGQLDGSKVDGRIAPIRGCEEGTDLISPSNHIDFHSIEDLANLLVVLRRANPYAAISVKLAATEGIGTVALGVAKALHAVGNPLRRDGVPYFRNAVYIQGKGGGSGNTPLASQQGAALSAEDGVAEAYQALALSGLHEYVDIIVDGQLRSPKDVVILAILGAKRFFFGTAALIALGCAMCRVCEKNTCPKGVASQAQKFRDKYVGKHVYLMRFMDEMALGVQDLLCALGVASLEELVGRTDLLEVLERLDCEHANRFNFDRLLYHVDPVHEPELEEGDGMYRDSIVDTQLLERAGGLFDAAEGEVTVDGLNLTNCDGPVGPRTAFELESRLQQSGKPWNGSLTANFHGTGAQHFGALLGRNVTFVLSGAANSFVGEGASEQATIVVRRPEDCALPRSALIALHGAFYGAMGGRGFFEGRVGNRLAAANHGGTVVVEGCGDYACQSMSKGRVVVLGESGDQFGSGMTGGEAFVYSPDGSILDRLNGDYVLAAPLSDDAKAETLRQLLLEHRQLTGSDIAMELLTQFDEKKAHFYLVTPKKKAKVTLDVISKTECVR